MTGPPSGPPSGPPQGPPSGPPPGPVGPPPAGPPRGPYAAEPARSGLAAWSPLAGLAAVVLLIVGIVVLSTGRDDTSSASESEVFLTPVSSIGNLPSFTPDVVPKAPVVPVGKPTRKAPGSSASTKSSGSSKPEATPTVQGGQPGLYGGTNQLSVCDAKQLVRFLSENKDKAKAWAATLGIPLDDISKFVAGLTDVVLERDTRVTNHGFKDGKANPLQSVLERGTAVLVDVFGVPRVRCKCGNPLTPPKTVPTTPTFTGEAWEDFDPTNVVAVVPAPAPVTTFTVANLDGGDPIARTPGVDVGDVQSSSSSSSSTSSSSSSSTSSSSSSSVAVAENVTAAGSATASSEFSSQYPASLGVDGDIGTSWFSGGSNADGDSSRFTWGVGVDSTITQIKVVGNAHDADPATRSGFGFESVTIQVLNTGGAVVFTQDVALPGTPDPDVEVAPNAVGSVVVLLFHGHEDPTCGGFAELQVFAHA